jgi:hypothetical protein
MIIAIFVGTLLPACQPLKQLTQTTELQQKQTEALDLMQMKLANMISESKTVGFDGHKWVASIGISLIAVVSLCHWGTTAGLQDRLGEFLQRYIRAHTVQHYHQ